MRIGVDLGGTKIECAVLSDSGEFLLRRRVPTPRGSYDETLDALAALVEECERAVTGRSGQRLPVGIGMPGALSPATGLVKNANSVWLNGRALARDLEERLGPRLRFANDANCFALSEATDGAASGARTVFGVIIGTGTGGGIVVDGRILTGPNAIAGEWGHNPLPWPEAGEWPGPPCYCGRRGCIETYLSGPGMARDHRETEGDPLDAPAIVEGARRRDPACTRTVERYCVRMARALASVLNLLDPDRVVLGGGMSNIDAIYETVPRRWAEWVFSDRVDTPLLRARYGDSSGVRGAAWLWP